ncbi:MAG: aminopeptidase, partial [Clostridia bacterium]|nr:aminopeptidase [Clostridia bacterium]
MVTKKRLAAYARLIVKTGVNVKRGQLVIIRADLDQPEFVKMVADEAYRAGARRVLVDWVYQPLEKSDYLYASAEELGTVQSFEKERWEYQAETLPCKIYLLSEDPDGLVGVDPAKMAEVGKMR